MKYRTNAEVEADMRKDPAWGGYFKSLDALNAKIKDSQKAKEEIQRKQDAILQELGFTLSFEDVMVLLQDEKRLKEVVSKLKMKAFW